MGMATSRQWEADSINDDEADDDGMVMMTITAQGWQLRLW